MEIPVMSRLTSALEAIINSLNVNNNAPTTSFISRLLDLQRKFTSQYPYPDHRFWKWGALFIALLYAFTNIASRLKILLLRRWRSQPSLAAASISRSPLTINLYDHDKDLSNNSDHDHRYESGEDDDLVGGGDVISSRSSSELESDEDEFERDFRVAGGYEKQRRRRSEGFSSLAELLTASCNGVVKLWEDSSFSNVIALNSDADSVLGSFPSQQGVVVSAVGLNLWDGRVRRRRPAVEVGGFGAVRVGKVYVGGDVEVAELVRDMREVNLPLLGLTGRA